MHARGVEPMVQSLYFVLTSRGGGLMSAQVAGSWGKKRPNSKILEALFTGIISKTVITCLFVHMHVGIHAGNFQ